MVGPRSPQSDRRGWHRLVEHYTPDGALGRLLLATVTGTVGVLSFTLAIFGFTAFGLGALLLGLLGTGLGLTASVLTILVLWPVYLSLIGNVESAAAYGEAVSAGSSVVADPIEVLKRQYAAGNVSDEEFERRLDALLDAEGRTGSRQASTSDERTTADALRETEHT